MELNISNFLILNGLVVAVVILFLIRSKPRHPSRLRLKEKSSSDKIIDVHRQKKESSVNVENTSAEGGEKDLNAFFAYNGHTFDAYEVLGLPAGSSFEAVKDRYGEILKEGDEESLHLSELAYKTICQKESRS